MKDFKSRFKKIVEAVFTRVTVKIITSLITFLFLAFIGYLKRTALKDYTIKVGIWLLSQHTLTFSGWGYLLLFLLPLFIFLILKFMLRLCFGDSDIYKRKSTIIKLLAEWAIKEQDNLSNGVIVHFREIDTQLELKKGTTRKYIKRVIDNHKKLRIEHVDKDTALIRGQ